MRELNSGNNLIIGWGVLRPTYTIMKKYELRNIARKLQIQQKRQRKKDCSDILYDINWYINYNNYVFEDKYNFEWLITELSKSNSAMAKVRDIPYSRISEFLNKINAPSTISDITFELINKRITPIQSILDDLVYIQIEFGEIKYIDNILSVITDDIILEDFNFSEFEIFFPSKINKYKYVDVLVSPLDAKLPCSDDDFPHPHVNKDILCPGDGLKALVRATRDIRVLDYFTIVNSILNTYGKDSPHLPIEYWTGLICNNCDDVAENNTCPFCAKITCDSCFDSCFNCSNEICELCINNNCYKCSTALCEGCSESICSDCEEIFCTNCVDDSCASCSENLCESCNTNKCSICQNYLCKDCLTKCDKCDVNICKNCECECKNDK